MRSRKLVKGSVLNTLNLVAQILSGFYVMPLMIHTFGDDMFGVWILIVSFMGYSAILDLGLPSAVSRFISQSIGRGGKESDSEIASITSTAFYIFLLISFVALLLILVLYAYTPSIIQNSEHSLLFRKLLLILCINNLFMFPAFIFEGMLVANLRHDLLNIRKVFFTVIKVFLTVVIIHFKGTLIWIAWLTVISNILENIIAVFMAYSVDKRISISPRFFNPDIVRQLFGYSIYTFIGKVADMLRFQIDSFVITIFCGVSQVTVFRIASRLIEYFMQFISGLTGVFNPYFSQEEGRNNFEGIKEKFLFITKVITYFASFIGVLLVLYGENFIIRWVGIEYTTSYKILIILTIPITFALVQSTVFPLLYGISKHKFVAFVNVAEGILNLILSVILAKKYGVFGVALGTAIPLIITKVFVQPFYVTKTLKIPMAEYVLTIIVPLIMTVSILVIPWLLIAQLLRPDFGNLLFYSTLQSVIFLIMIFFFGFTKLEQSYFLNVMKIKR